MIHAFRTIEIHVALSDGREFEARVPFTVELLHRVKYVLRESEERHWLVELSC